jgi:hypothetical protein
MVGLNMMTLAELEQFGGIVEALCRNTGQHMQTFPSVHFVPFRFGDYLFVPVCSSIVIAAVA